MFADNFDDEKAAKKDEEKKMEEEKAKAEEEKMNLDEVIKWEFRWENKDDAEIHGPHTSEEMLKWQVGTCDRTVWPNVKMKNNPIFLKIEEIVLHKICRVFKDAAKY